MNPPAASTPAPVAAGGPAPAAPHVAPLSTAGAIRTNRLSKTYGRRQVVKGVDLTVHAGEIVGLLGPNGAGKTTTFYMIVGLVPATSGEVLLDERPVTRLRMHERARRGIGYLPQEASVFRKLTVEENVRAVAETLALGRKARGELVEKQLHDLGLTHLAKQKAYTLSGGERRRLEVARALAANPRFLLLDEPFAGVDPISVADVQRIVLSLKSRGIGILITDHHVRETLRVVDRAYLIHDGTVLSQGTSEFLINDPQSRKFYLGENFNL